MPHAAYERAAAFHEMREKLAGLRACFVDGAKIVLEKNAAVLIALEDTAFIGRLDSVIAEKLRDAHADEARQTLDIALGDLRSGDAAAVRTLGAVDRVFHTSGDRLEAAFDKVMTLHPGTEAAVFFALLFAEALDLDEVGKKRLRQGLSPLLSRL